MTAEPCRRRPGLLESRHGVTNHQSDFRRVLQQRRGTIHRAYDFPPDKVIFVYDESGGSRSDDWTVIVPKRAITQGDDR